MTMNRLADAYENAANALAALAAEIRAEGSQERPGAPLDAFADGTPIEEPPTDYVWHDDEPGPVRSRPFQDTPQGRSEFGGCPVHDVPWVIKPAGTAKATGKPYAAFWHCNEKNDDGTYCRQKPTREWAAAHAIR
jgi:hypothetical protein